MNMLDHLDDKSEWRKKLLELAGKSPIKECDIHKLRSFVRFEKFNNKNLTPFQSITNEIIDYCEHLYNNYVPPYINDDECPNNNNESFKCQKTLNLSKEQEEMIRIFARYLLANHWEVLQLTQAEKFRYNEKKGFSNNHYTKLETLYLISINLLYNEKIDKKVERWIDKENKLYNYTNQEYEKLLTTP